MGYHLSAPAITYRNQSAYPSASNEQFSGADLCGISACKVYPQIMLPLNAVSSYLTFSPLSCSRWDSYFLWHFLFPTLRQAQDRDPAIHRCIALCCPDFPIPPKAGSIAWLVAKFLKELTAKINIDCGIKMIGAVKNYDTNYIALIELSLRRNPFIVL